MFAFAKALAGAHAKKLVQEVTDAVVDKDPTTASEAQLHMMEQSLDQLGSKLGTYRTELTRENTEAVAAQKVFDNLSAAAANLNGRYEAETDPAKKTELGNSLNGLLTTLEDKKRDLDDHNAHVADAQALVREAEEAYQRKATELRDAKANLQQAARERERARLDEQHAQEQAERAAEIAGLRDNKADGLNAALDSLHRQTEEAKARADAARTKASVLGKAQEGGLEDPNVLAALREVQAPASNQSFTDRLAALSAKKS